MDASGTHPIAAFAWKTCFFTTLEVCWDGSGVANREGGASFKVPHLLCLQVFHMHKYQPWI